MITGLDLSKIKNELLKLFPEVENINDIPEHNIEKFDYQTFCLYLSTGKRVILKFSKDYLDQNSFDAFKKHLQRIIYYVCKCHLNKTIYLLKNFEIEVVNDIDEFSYA